MENEKLKPNENFVFVEVLTTSGSYPEEGYEKTPINQKLDVVLKKAEKRLKLTNTNNWVVRVNETELDCNTSYKQYSLSGKISIDFGPREGGGGML